MGAMFDLLWTKRGRERKREKEKKEEKEEEKKERCVCVDVYVCACVCDSVPYGKKERTLIKERTIKKNEQEERVSATTTSTVSEVPFAFDVYSPPLHSTDQR